MVQGIWTTLGRVRQWCIDVMAALAGFMLLLMMLAITYAVVMRALNMPAAWVMEVSTYMLLYITFLGAPWLLAKGGHVKVDLVFEALSPRGRRFLDLLTSLLGLAIALVLTWAGVWVTLDNWARHIMVINILATPKAWLLVVIPLGSFFLATEFTRRLGYSLNNSKRVIETGVG